MELHALPAEAGGRRARKRVGRGPGSGTGKTSGKGHKGQKARSGYSRRRGFEGGQMPLNRRLPKRGFTQETRFPVYGVNLDTLDRFFAEGAEVSLETLAAAGLGYTGAKRVKILARGEVTKPLKVVVHAISAGAKSKIEAAGGQVTVLPIPKQLGRKRRAKPASA